MNTIPPWRSLSDELDLAVNGIRCLCEMHCQLLESDSFSITRGTATPLYETVLNRLDNVAERIRAESESELRPPTQQPAPAVEAPTDEPKGRQGTPGDRVSPVGRLAATVANANAVLLLMGHRLEDSEHFGPHSPSMQTIVNTLADDLDNAYGQVSAYVERLEHQLKCSPIRAAGEVS